MLTSKNIKCVPYEQGVVIITLNILTHLFIKITIEMFLLSYFTDEKTEEQGVPSSSAPRGLGSSPLLVLIRKQTSSHIPALYNLIPP